LANGGWTALLASIGDPRLSTTQAPAAQAKQVTVMLNSLKQIVSLCSQ
jgi:hypothetical protein